MNFGSAYVVYIDNERLLDERLLVETPEGAGYKRILSKAKKQAKAMGLSVGHNVRIVTLRAGHECDELRPDGGTITHQCLTSKRWTITDIKAVEARESEELNQRIYRLNAMTQNARK